MSRIPTTNAITIKAKIVHAIAAPTIVISQQPINVASVFIIFLNLLIT